MRAYVPERVQVRQKGIEDWFYTGMGITDGDLLQTRALGWVSWKFKAHSWTIWEFDFNSLRAYSLPETYTERNGDPFNGMGMLIYRGETMGIDGPVPSIPPRRAPARQPGLRVFLAARPQEGRTRGGGLDRDPVVHEPMGRRAAWGSPGMWSHNGEEWERDRYRMGDLITTLPDSAAVPSSQ